MPKPSWGMGTMAVVARGKVATMLRSGAVILDRETVVGPSKACFISSAFDLVTWPATKKVVPNKGLDLVLVLLLSSF